MMFSCETLNCTKVWINFLIQMVVCVFLKFKYVRLPYKL